MNHLVRAVEFTIKQENHEEVQEVTEKQEISQRGWKIVRQRTRIPTTSMHASSRRLNTRSKSKGLNDVFNFSARVCQIRKSFHLSENDSSRNAKEQP